VEDEQWLRHLLDVCRQALEKRREGPEADEELALALEEFSARLEERLRAGRGGSDS
jgi:hypothetical protein